MDPSIVKLLEDDVDETMHSGAEVEALTAALNRDIGGDMSALAQPSISNSSVKVLEKGQASGQGQNPNPSIIHEQQRIEQQKHLMPESNKDQQNNNNNNKQGEKKTDVNSSASITRPTENKIQPANQQAPSVGQASGKKGLAGPKAAPTIPFQMLMPILRPHLDKDRDMQLQAVFAKLRSNEVSKEDFLRVIRNIVGDQMLRQAAHTVHTQMQAQAARAAAQQAQAQTPGPTSTPTLISNPNPNPKPNPNQYSLLNQASSTQQQFPTPHPMAQKQNPSQIGTGRPELKSVQTLQNRPPILNNPMQTLNRPITQSSYYARPPVNPQSTLRPPQVPWQIVASNNKDRFQVQPGFVKQESVEHKQTLTVGSVREESLIGGKLTARTGPGLGPGSGPGLGPGSVGSASSSQVVNHGEPNINMQMSSPAPPHPTPATTKTPQKKPSAGQKKPLESVGGSPPSKKQKTSGALLDQSIEQLNDVTAVSGVNLREEEEQLLAGPKEEPRVSEATRRVVQEEEEKLILQKGALHRKLSDIMSKCNLISVGSDVERCLSMCVEERLKGLISNLIRLSKQRVDIEKTAHKVAVTSDVHRHILMVNKKAKEEWDKKQAEEAEKLRKQQSEVEGNDGLEPEKDKDEAKSSKNAKVNKEEDDKMRTTAANVAARAAVGGDDMLSKWQLMAERARLKRDSVPSISQQPGSSPVLNSKSLSRPGKGSSKDSNNQDMEKKGQSSVTTSGGMRRPGRAGPPALPAQLLKVERNISVKDVISVLEREPQMSKSSLVYRLYDRLGPPDSPSEI